MARPLRIECAGALYHVTARGNERRAIFLADDEADRQAFLQIFAATCERFGILHLFWEVVNGKWET